MGAVLMLAYGLELQIDIIENGDFVECLWMCNGEKKGNKTKNKIRYTIPKDEEEECIPYFVKNNQKYFINEFIKKDF